MTFVAPISLLPVTVLDTTNLLGARLGVACCCKTAKKQLHLAEVLFLYLFYIRKLIVTSKKEFYFRSNDLAMHILNPIEDQQQLNSLFEKIFNKNAIALLGAGDSVGN